MSFDDRRSLREPTSDVCEGLRSCSRDLFHPDGLCRVSTKELLRLPCAVVVLDSVHATLAVDSIGRVRLQCMALDPLGSTPSAIWPIRGCAAGQSMVFVLSFLNMAYNFA